MNHNELRNEFLDFFKNKEHKIVPSSPVIPYDDPTLMFTNAGMNQFKEVLAGHEKRSYTRAVSVQKCIRVSGKHNDFEIVGFDGTHHTFFEMLGNWSFGDYYKKEAIMWAWEILTKIWQFPKDKLAVSIYKDDEESYKLWRDMIKVPEEMIIRLGDLEKGDEENFWSMGDTGPCGFCTEIHYHNNDKKISTLDEKTFEENFTEIWNLVFMEFYRNTQGNLSPLKSKNVDTGMGFERLYTILKGENSNYHTDLFMPMIDQLEKLSKKKYKDHATSFQVIADHIRALTFSIADGGHFSNEGRGYVLRKILRRALRHSKNIGFNDTILYKIVDTVIKNMGDAYPELHDKQANIEKFIRIEEEKFLTTLDKGLNQLKTIIKQLSSEKKKVIPGEEVFNLYDRFGFPFDITKEIACEHKLSVDEQGFHQHMEKQKERGRKSWESERQAFNIEELVPQLKKIPDTKFMGYDCLETEAKILAIIADDKIKKETQTDQNKNIALILDQTTFYAESGGQIGDQGMIFNQDFQIQIMDTQKINNYFLHIGQINYGEIEPGAKVIVKVDSERRLATMKNHTATHLLQSTLRKVIGDHIVQAGSYVSPERLRFDFRHFEGIKQNKIYEIEKMVNTVIQQNIEVNKSIKDKEEAIKMGAMAIFGEKYGEKVRVIKIDKFSTELCGGTHLNATGEIGLFVILSEMSIASGIRRIEAITGQHAIEYVQNIRHTSDQIKSVLKVPDEDITERLNQLIKENKELEKKLQSNKFNNTEDITTELISNAVEKNSSKLIFHIFTNEDNKYLNSLGDRLLNNIKDGVVYFINNIKDENKYSMLLLISTNLINKGLHADKILKKVVGSGGGRKDRAQAGGKGSDTVDKTLNDVKQNLLNQI